MRLQPSHLMPAIPATESEPPSVILPEPPPRKEAASASQVHLDYLDGLRALAALTVVLCHCVLPNWHEWPLGISITSKLRLFSLYDNLGHFAVNLFIVLSGFCLMLPVVRNGGFLKGGSAVFLKKRAIRILPSYYLATAFTLLLIGTLIGHQTGTPWDVSLPVTDWNILANLLLVQNFTEHAGAINHAYWSVSLEWWVYFLFPALILSWRRFGALGSILLAMALSVILVGGCLFLFERSYTLQYVGLFAMGVFAASIAGSGNPSSRWLAEQMNGVTLAVLTLFVLVLCRFGVKLLGGQWGPPLIDYVVGVWVVCLLVMLISGRLSFLRKGLSFRPIVFIGTFAYSIYLTHAPIVQILWEYGIAPMKLPDLEAYVLFKILAIPTTVCVAYGFYLICERPFVRVKQRFPEMFKLPPKMKSHRIAG